MDRIPGVALSPRCVQVGDLAGDQLDPAVGSEVAAIENVEGR
jgi:hypothetical protein